MTHANFNYTGRNEIVDSQYKVFAINNKSTVKGVFYKIELDEKFINSFSTEDSVLVLDARKRDKFERVVLDQKLKQQIHMSSFQKENKPDLRISLVSKDDDKNGLILLSTRAFKENNGKQHNPRKNKKKQIEIEEEYNFFNTERSDEIGEQLWKLDWSNGTDVTILINERLEDMFMCDMKNPMLRGFILPSIVKSIFQEIFLRFNTFEEIKDHEICNWFLWGSTVTSHKIPCEGFKEGDFWLAWLDNVLADFCDEKRGKEQLSLISSMEKYVGEHLK